SGIFLVYSRMNVSSAIDWQALEPFTLLGIDEIALSKGHRDFVAVLTAKTASARLHVLAILPDRLKASVAAWLQAIPEEQRCRIHTVCTDMWEGYVTAVRDVLPAATLVIERFHVARHYRDGLDRLRKQELRRVRARLSDELQHELKHIVWPSRKRPADLDEEEQAQLERFLVHSPALRQAIMLREELTTIFDTARGRPDGLRRIRFWRQRVSTSGVTCFDGFLSLLDTWLELIANYIIDHQTSAFVEGLNNKLKVLKRRCYGLCNDGRLGERLTRELDGYRGFS